MLPLIHCSVLILYAQVQSREEVYGGSLYTIRFSKPILLFELWNAMLSSFRVHVRM